MNYTGKTSKLDSRSLISQIKKGKQLSQPQCQQLVDPTIPLDDRNEYIIALIRKYHNDMSGLQEFLLLLQKYCYEFVSGKNEVETSNLFNYLAEKFKNHKDIWESQGLMIRDGVIKKNKPHSLERFIIELHLWTEEFRQLIEDILSENNRVLENLLQLPKRLVLEKTEENTNFLDMAMNKLQNYAQLKKSRGTPGYSRSNSSTPMLEYLDFYENQDNEANRINAHNPWKLNDLIEHSPLSIERNQKMEKLKTRLDENEYFTDEAIYEALEKNNSNIDNALEDLRRELEIQRRFAKKMYPERPDFDINRHMKWARGDLAIAMPKLSKDHFAKVTFNHPQFDSLDDLFKAGFGGRKRRLRIAHAEFFSDFKDGDLRADYLIRLFETSGNDNLKPNDDRKDWWEFFDMIALEKLVNMVKTIGNLKSFDEIYDSPIINKQCSICLDNYPYPEIFTFRCPKKCSFCNGCIMQNIKSNLAKSQMLLSCPICENNEDEDGETLVYVHLEKLSRRNESYNEIFSNFQALQSRHTLESMKDFTQCSHQPCDGGYVRAKGATRRMVCNVCKKKTCHECKLPWYPNHKNVPCADYKKWLAENHPEVLSPELVEGAEYIVCPQCENKYELARGGCLHFLCPTCQFEFCGFCQQPFHKPNKNPCTTCDITKGKGMHAHHPRNCPYFLRDREVKWLRDLVEHYKINMDELLPPNESDNGTCNLVMADDDMKTDNCDDQPGEDCQGYCIRHFKELISGAIFKRKEIDPVVLMTKEEMMVLAERENIDYEKDWSEENLREVIIDNNPLEDKGDD